MDTDQDQSRNYPLCPLGDAHAAALPLCLKGSQNPTLSNSWNYGLVDWNAAERAKGRRFEDQVRVCEVCGMSVVCVTA